MKRRGPSSASAFRRSTSSGAATVRFATTSVTSNGRPSPRGRRRRARPAARSPPRRRSIRSRRSQPDDVAGSVETMISSIGCARDGVHRGVERVGVADLAVAGDAEVADELERQVHADLRGVAHDLVVDDVAVPRPRLRARRRRSARPPRPPLADRDRAASRRRSSRSRGPGPSALTRPPRSTLGRRCAPAGCFRPRLLGRLEDAVHRVRARRTRTGRRRRSARGRS